jgi:hypothetical protein
LLKILNYEDAQIRYLNLSSAEFAVDNAAFFYGNGIYWYPSHSFNVVIPSLIVQSPQTTKKFEMTNQFPGGMGYFAVEKPDMPPVDERGPPHT